MSVRLLTVCTGNICRSPYAQHVLQHGLDRVRPDAFDVSSAGTHALVGHPIEPDSARNLTDRGIASDEFVARQLSEPMLADVDMLLPLEVEHRKLVLSYSPRHLKRTYTLKEFARLLDAAGARQPWTERLAGLDTVEQRWAALPNHLARERGISRVEDGVDDIADPYRQAPEVFDVMADEIDEAVERIVAFEAQFD